MLQSIAYFKCDVQKYWGNENYFGYVYLIYDQKENKGYVGHKFGKIRSIEKYSGSGTIISNIKKKRGIYFLKKIILGVCYSYKELVECETVCKHFFNVLDRKYGYNILEKDTFGDTFTNNPNKEEIRKKLSEKMNDPIWIETIGKEKYKKQSKAISKTMNDVVWKETVGKECALKISRTVNNPEWIERIGKNARKKAAKKSSETQNNPEWIEKIGKKMHERANKEMIKTFNDKEWKLTKGKEKSDKLIKIFNDEEWKNTIGKDKNKKRLETINNPIWIETTGKLTSKKISEKRLDPIWKEKIGNEANERGSKKLKEKYFSGEITVWCDGLTKENNEILQKISEKQIKLWLNMTNEEKQKRGQGISKIKNDPVWKETIGKMSVIKSSETKKKNGTAKGGNNPKAIKIINLDTNEIFDCMKDASIAYNISIYSLRLCCKGKRETCFSGFHWKYLNE